MKLARTMAIAVIITTSVCGHVSAGNDKPGPDVTARIHTYLPQREGDWNDAAGVELQVRFWSEKAFGTALSIGMDSWQARNEYAEESDADGTYSSSIFGNLTMVPVGASVLYRNEVSDKLSVILEAGVRYVFTRSNLNAEITVSDAIGETRTRDTIYFDNAFLGVVGITIEASIDGDFSFLCGVGYQFDLTDPHETFMNEDLGAASFASPTFNIGLTWAF